MLLEPRLVYAPFEYQQAYDYWEKQQMSHWLHNEISMASDIADWKVNLTDAEKSVIGGVLKGFVQAEVVIADYWSNKVANYFKKPEIQMMANSFAAFETIHQTAYAYLNESLGLDEFDAFLHEPAAKAKIDRLVEIKGKSKKDIARSLAIFSAFNEGVNLFSSFMILMNFSRFNKMRGLGQVIAYSIRDESLHSEAGCWLFRSFVEEYPEILDDELKKDLYNAARLTVQLEDNFIDSIFKFGEVEGITKEQVKNYIRFRTNTKLQDIGLKSNWKNIDKKMIDEMMWFDLLSNGVEMQDFFAQKSTAYSKSGLNWDDIYKNEEVK